MATDLKNIRESLGMSQELMASILGISRSTLALVETKKRSLSTAAMIKLDVLLQVLHSSNLSPSDKALGSLQKQLQKHRTLISKRVEKLYKQSEKLQRKLDQMKEEYKQCIKALETSAYMTARLTNTAADKVDKEAMQLLEAQTVKKTRQCNPGAQAILAMRIRTLKFEADQSSLLVF